MSGVCLCAARCFLPLCRCRLSCSEASQRPLRERCLPLTGLAVRGVSCHLGSTRPGNLYRGCLPLSVCVCTWALPGPTIFKVLSSPLCSRVPRVHGAPMGCEHQMRTRCASQAPQCPAEAISGSSKEVDRTVALMPRPMAPGPLVHAARLWALIFGCALGAPQGKLCSLSHPRKRVYGT